MTRKLLFFVLPAVIGALAIAGCGDDGDSGGAYGGKDAGAASAQKPASGSGSGAALLRVAPAADVGPVLVDGRGLTVYDFHKDKGTTSSCYGGCAKIWPPVLTEGAPRSGAGASAADLGTTRRKDGGVQVTYGGHPLYTYAGDEKPGEANGHDIDSFGAEWYALTGSGAEAED